MHSKLTATDHTYVHSYRRFLSFDVSQTQNGLTKVNGLYKLEHNVQMKRFGVVCQNKMLFEVEPMLHSLL